MRYISAIIAAIVVCTIASLLGIGSAQAQPITPAATYKTYLAYLAGPASAQTAAEREMAEQVLSLVNSERASAGCGPLSFNQKLTDAAQAHSEDMARNNFFSHTGSDGSSSSQRVTRAGYSWSYTGENVAAGYATADAVMQGWMNSDGHRANILRCSFTEIGIGYIYEADDTFPGPYGYSYYWTQVFARP
ncbi:MAG: CAP domain-containing protein [Chloroflexales bacterium]|nr:CAP domain-containing protein [Chloroflexales bacterium]